MRTLPENLPTLRFKGDASYWVIIRKLKASLLLGGIDVAIAAYSEAVEPWKTLSFPHREHTQASLQISSLYSDESIRENIAGAFPVLGIVACSGHVIDNES